MLKHFSRKLTKVIDEKRSRTTERPTLIYVNGVNGAQVLLILHHIYALEAYICRETIIDIITAALALDIELVQGFCTSFLRQQLEYDPHNALYIKFVSTKFPDLSNFSRLFDDIDENVANHFLSLSEYPEFLYLTSNELCEYLKRDDLEVYTEEDVFNIVMKWIRFKEDKRQQHFIEFVKHIRLPQFKYTVGYVQFILRLVA